MAIEHLRAQTPGRGDGIGVLDGEQVGVGTCSLPIGMEASAVAWSMLFVLREARHQAVGGSLYRRVSEHARTLGRSELHMYSFEDDADTAGFGERHGFRVVARVRGLRLPLERCPRPQVDAPACEAFPDMPSPDDAPVQAGSYEQFVAAQLSGPRHIPQATFVAVADGQVVGDSQLGWLRRSAGIADGAMIAVRRGWRGRGLARALKAAQIAWAIDNGLSELRSGNEERNAPARAVNAHFPYVPVPDMLHLRGPPPSGQTGKAAR